MKPDDLAARGVRVKALEWENGTLIQTAQTPWGRYAVGNARGNWLWAWNGTSTKAESEEAAKAAAQADYEARILAALEDTGEPALIREAEARGMERAAVIADRHLSKVEINEPLWHEGQDWAAESIALAIRAEAAALCRTPAPEGDSHE